MLKLITWKNPEFNYRFDGIVYAVAVGIGFAVFENISYAIQYGLTNTLVRAVTAIPGHCIFAIFMGHFYGLAKQAWAYNDKTNQTNFMALAYVVPVLLHGFYDLTASHSFPLSGWIFIVFVIIIDAIAILNVKNIQVKICKYKINIILNVNI